MLSWVKNILLAHKARAAIVLILIVIGIFIWQFYGKQNSKVQYQTAAATKDTIIASLNESGQVVVANRLSITTQTTGVISEVDVKNGDTVTAGQKIATISLDTEGLQRQAQSYASYLSAKSSLDAANAALFSLQSTLFSKWNTFSNKATNSTYQNPDGSPNTSNRTLPDFTTTQDDWLSAEAQYKNQQNVINQSQASLNNAWLSYQANSPAITTPIGGVISDLTIAPGMQISGSSTTTNISSQLVGTIKTDGKPIISVNLSEVDATKVLSNQKATITFDALPNQTFTGKVLGINTTGGVSSGVTTYPATIQLDVANDKILPNMSATANIITDIKNDVIVIPSSAIQTNNGQSTVRILKNGSVTTVPVETGISSDTQTEIISGVNIDDNVITGVISSASQQSNTSSPFGGAVRGFGGGGFGGGGAVRVGGGARGGN